MRRETNTTNYAEMRDHEVDHLRERVKELERLIEDYKAQVVWLQVKNEELESGVPVEEHW